MRPNVAFALENNFFTLKSLIFRATGDFVAYKNRFFTTMNDRGVRRSDLLAHTHVFVAYRSGLLICMSRSWVPNNHERGHIEDF
jgi:hypothetical protein